MFKWILHAEVRTGVLPMAFAVILRPVALPILLKVEFNFKVIMYITIFVSHIQKAALNMWSVMKTYLKMLRSSCFHNDGRKTNIFARKVWGLCTPWFSVLRPPKHWFEFFLSIFKTQSRNFSMLGMKTRPWKFRIWPAMRHDYHRVFREGRKVNFLQKHFS